jgi:hypothetical protein
LTHQPCTRIVCLCALAASAVTAADPAYAGKWKLNPAKSDFGAAAIEYSQTASGVNEYIEQGQSYKYRMDGKDYVTPFGYTARWRQIDARTWETKAKLKDQVIETDMTRLSEDGKRLTVTSKGAKPNGEAWEDSSVYQRVAGSAGLSGKWKPVEVKVGSLKFVEISSFGEDGLTWKIPDYAAAAAARFDGKDYPVTGPTAPRGLTVAIRRSGPYSFEMKQKVDGKAAYQATYTVSADGKTLTQTGSPAGAAQSTTWVYDRQ